jgi:ABC-type nitrate/sulfonate/bicarbonate transport system permease component
MSLPEVSSYDVDALRVPEGVAHVSDKTARPRRGLGGRVGARAIAPGALILALGVWEAVAVLVVRDPVTLPSPVAVVRSFIYYMHHPYPAQNYPLWEHLLVSTIRIAAGFITGAAVGIALGAGMVGARPIRRAIDPFIELARPLPPLAFIPLLVVWFGIGNLPKVLLIFIGVVPIMAIATVAGLDGVPQELVAAARTLGASHLYAMWHVRVRAAMGQVVTGMRVAVGVSWTSIVAAEMIAAQHGIGYVILEAGNYLDTSLLFAAIACIGIVGLGMDRLLRLLLRRVDPSFGRR